MQTFHLLESKNYVAGGNVQISLRDLPPKKRIKAFVLRLEATWTQSGSPTAAAGDDLCRVFQNIEVGKRIKGTGAFFDRLNWMQRGGQLAMPGQVPATASTVFRRTLTCVVPFVDLYAMSMMDTAPLAEYFRDTPLIVDFAGAALFSTITIAGTLRTFAILEDAEDGVVPSALQMGYTDWSGQTMYLEPGLYTHAFLYKEATGGSTVTNAEVTSVYAVVDGATVVNLLRPEELAITDDYFFAKGGAWRTESATAPVVGEQLSDVPALTGGAAATVTMEWVPLLQVPANYKLTSCFEVKKSLRLDFQGSLTSFRVGWRRIEPRSAEQAVKAMAKAGIQHPNVNAIRAKTHSKKDLTGHKARMLSFLPLRHD